MLHGYIIMTHTHPILASVQTAPNLTNTFPKLHHKNHKHDHNWYLLPANQTNQPQTSTQTLCEKVIDILSVYVSKLKLLKLSPHDSWCCLPLSLI